MIITTASLHSEESVKNNGSFKGSSNWPLAHPYLHISLHKVVRLMKDEFCMDAPFIGNNYEECRFLQRLA